jgi:hypothetical protein
MPMTTAEVKVKELSEKLLDIIAGNRNANASPETTLKNIEAYLGGICDGIDLSEEMRRCEHEVIAKIDQHDAKTDTPWPAPH